jgi:hypothetical protein
MSGGAISGNKAVYGGGVYAIYGTFTKSSAGGIIYGSDALTSLKNTASGDSYGHAAYVPTDPAKKRNSTVNASDILSSSSSYGWE